MKTMRVARLHGIGDIRLRDEPIPTPRQDESLIRVTAVGICGSDLHWFARAGIGDARLAQPLILGHEFAGVVESGKLRGRRVADAALREPVQVGATNANGGNADKRFVRARSRNRFVAQANVANTVQARHAHRFHRRNSVLVISSEARNLP